MAITTAAPPAKTAPPRSRSGGPRHHQSKRWLPYVLIAPAVVFELLVHFTPMVTGVWISFLDLTNAFIANWAAAPFAEIGRAHV